MHGSHSIKDMEVAAVHFLFQGTLRKTKTRKSKFAGAWYNSL